VNKSIEAHLPPIFQVEAQNTMRDSVRYLGSPIERPLRRRKSQAAVARLGWLALTTGSI